MEYFLLNNGQKIPKIGMGTSRMIDPSTIIEEGLKAGYRMIDTALIYRNEEHIGNVVKKAIQDGTVKREDVFIISKLLNSRHKKEDVLPQIKKSLKNLQLDYLDLYLIHFPFSKKMNGTSTIIEEGLNAGYRMIDTALMYGSEEHIGNVLKKAMQEGKIKREDVFISSKLLNSRHKKEEVIPQIKKSLKNLQLDYLDLYLIHFPFCKKVGPNENEIEIFSGVEDDIPLEETWRAMEECVQLGLTKGIGFCSFNSKQIERILKIATIKPVVNEVECNPYFSQEKLRKFCAEKKILNIGFSPFYSYNKTEYIDTHGLNLFEEPIVKSLAQKYKKSMGNIILRYLIQNGVVPIPKTDNVDRLKENIKIFDFTLSEEDVEKMKSLNNNKRCVNFEEAVKFKEYPFNIEY